MPKAEHRQYLRPRDVRSSDILQSSSERIDPTSLHSILGREVPPEDQAIFNAYLDRKAQIKEQYDSGALVIGQHDLRPEVAARAEAVVALRSLRDNAGNYRYTTPEIAKAMGVKETTIKYDLKRGLQEKEENSTSSTVQPERDTATRSDVPASLGMPRSLIADPLLESDVQELLKAGISRPSKIADELGILPLEAVEIKTWITDKAKATEAREGKEQTAEVFSRDIHASKDTWSSAVDDTKSAAPVTLLTDRYGTPVFAAKDYDPSKEPNEPK